MSAGSLELVDGPEHGYVQVRPDNAYPFDADSYAEQALAWETTIHVCEDETILLENALDRLDGRDPT